MSDPTDQSSAKRKKITDQAMQILRETRAKIDPVLLNLMKDKIHASGMAPKMPAPLEKKGVFSAKDVDDLSVKKPAAQAEPKISANNAAATYAAQAATPVTKPNPSKPEMVPVDRQKIAAIVMEYMRLREEKKPGH